MSDIMSFIRNVDAFEQDPDGNLLDLEEWDQTIAHKLAEEEGIQLTEQHMEVVNFLREWFRRNGEADSATMLIKYVEGKFAHQGGRQYLYKLFPAGPITQGCKIAGLPVPAHSRNASFGSVQ